MSRRHLFFSEVTNYFQIERNLRVERFSIKCRKPKTQSNHTGQPQRTQTNPLSNQNSKKIADAKRGKMCAGDSQLLLHGFTSDWLRKWRELLNQSQSVVDAKPKQTRITLDSQVKTAPIVLQVKGLRHRSCILKKKKSLTFQNRHFQSVSIFSILIHSSSF